jgi:hypothetical protein
MGGCSTQTLHHLTGWYPLTHRLAASRSSSQLCSAAGCFWELLGSFWQFVSKCCCSPSLLFQSDMWRPLNLSIVLCQSLHLFQSQATLNCLSLHLFHLHITLAQVGTFIQDTPGHMLDTCCHLLDTHSCAPPQSGSRAPCLCSHEMMSLDELPGTCRNHKPDFVSNP